ncbi:LAFE_0G04148g1_1 [Lachancea fermentati]|uniref:LAFE_0G04148g1_1 n=1 Tax=Lachancea fermentati TaxID=4955 RepID=A0A1G4MHB5_LACFM|nr:LAFE_0G04148g1_1 [Lachancea fermentati]
MLALWIIVLLASSVFGDVSIVAPSAGGTYEPSGSTVSIDVKWADDNSTPKLSDIDSYTFLLCYGSNANIKCLDSTTDTVEASTVSADSDDKYTHAFSFSSSLAGNGQYFIQINAISKKLGYTLHYTPRFTLKSMSGTSTQTYSTNTQPPAQTDITSGGNTNVATTTVDTSVSFTVPYTLQTGLTRYAPMQMQPGTTVTATTWTRRFPTSAVTYYSTFRNSLNQVSTVTPGWSYILSSAVNYASPAPFPVSNGGWYDPKSRQTLTTRKRNAGAIRASSTA